LTASLFAVLCALLLTAQAAGTAAPADASGLLLSPIECSADLGTIKFDFRVQDYSIRRASGCKDGDFVFVPGLHNLAGQGLPSLPVKGFFVGVPPNTTGARVHVELFDFTIQRDCFVAPVEAREGQAGVEGCDDGSEVYHRPGLFPEKPVMVSRLSFFRSQKIALVQVFPVQFSPTDQTVRINLSGSVTIEFVDSGTGPVLRPTDVDEGCFERLFESLLVNYDQARDFRVARSELPGVESLAGAYWYDPSRSYLKVFTNADGLYRVDYTLLKSAGLDPLQLETEKLALLYRGKPVPVAVFDGGDGRFDRGDFLVFFGMRKLGEEIGWYLDEYTDETVWWLCQDDRKALRFRPVPAQTNRAVSALGADSFFMAREHFEQDILYDGWNDPTDGDSWFWEKIPFSPNSVSVHFPLFSVCETASTRATIAVVLKAITSIWDVNPDHHTRLWLNGTLIEDVYWDSDDVQKTQMFKKIAVSVPVTALRDGQNTLTVEHPGDTQAGTNGEADSVYLDWIEVEYPRRYEARNGVLCFRAPAGFRGGGIEYRLEGFGQNDVMIVDVATGRAFTEYWRAKEGGRWVVRFVDPEPSQASQYWAAAQYALMQPDSVEIDKPSTLRDTRNQADLIIITRPEFYNAVSQLVNYREAQGYSVKVVDVEDVFDEFNFGLFHPLAIRSFLWYAYHFWEDPAPTHVLLVGDASWDYKFLLAGSRTANYVPSYMDPARDDKFTNVTGKDIDWYPDFAIGRYPVCNAQELTAMIAKTIAYETHPPPGDWTRRALFVTGGDKFYEWDTFQLQAHQLEAILPERFEAREVFKDDAGWERKEYYAQRMIDEMNQGVLFVVFLGHGAITQWDFMFQDFDLWRLNCNGRMPIVLSMTCHTGRFANPQIDCIGEQFVKEGDVLDRAVGYWGSTGLSSVWYDYYLVENLFHNVFDKGITDMGLAIMGAKLQMYQDYYSRDIETVVSSQVWLGDPLLCINLSPLPSPFGVTASVGQGTALVEWSYPNDVAGLSGFVVRCERSTDGGGSGAVEELFVGSDKRQAVFEGLVPGVRYCATIVAVAQDGKVSPPSEPACFVSGRAGSSLPIVVAGGYAGSKVSSEDGGMLEMFALVSDNDGPGDIDRVEILWDGLGTGIYMQETEPGLFCWSERIGPGLSPGLYLLGVIARDKEGNASACFPYLSIRGWGQAWPPIAPGAAPWAWGDDDGEPDGPLILAAGYITGGITSFSGGEVTMLALVVPGRLGAKVTNVGVFFDGVFTGAELFDDGQHGDFGPGDSVWGLEGEFGPGQVPGNYLLSLRAVDENGLTSSTWPFLKVW